MRTTHTNNLTIMMVFFLLSVFQPLTSDAATITYVNSGSADSRVFVGFDNNASGNTTSDFVSDPAAYSRNDTVYGPLPPPGQLPNFDATAYAAAELGTNLNAPLGTGIRSVFSPLNLTYFQAHGETLLSTGYYSSSSYVHSGQVSSTSPTAWILHVDPSGSEVAGQLADVTITGNISGVLTVAGTSMAVANWNVTTTVNGSIVSGSSTLSAPGTTNFSDSGTITFSIPLGSTFELLVDYNLSTSGSGAGANSTSEVTSSLVEISATVPSNVVVPVITGVFPIQIWPPKPILVSIQKSFEIYNPDNLKYKLLTRVFTNENTEKQDALTDEILVPGDRDSKGKGRFYLVILYLADELGNEQKEVVFGAYVPLTDTTKDILKIEKRAQKAQEKITEALKESSVYDLNPADFHLYEYGWQ